MYCFEAAEQRQLLSASPWRNKVTVYDPPLSLRRMWTQLKSDRSCLPVAIETHCRPNYNPPR